MNKTDTPVTRVLDTKQKSGIAVVDQNDTVKQAAERMTEHAIGSLLVTHGSKEVMGIVTERDCLRHLARADADACGQTPISEIMTENVVAVGPTHTVTQCLNIMNKRRIRHLPVLKDGAVLGLISQGDLVHELVDDQHATIDDLARYILDVYPGMPLISPPLAAPPPA